MMSKRQPDMKRDRLAAALAHMAQPEPKRVIKPPPPETWHKRLSRGQVADIHRLAAKGISQRKIADAVGTNQAVVHRVLSGKAYAWMFPSNTGMIQ